MIRGNQLEIYFVDQQFPFQKLRLRAVIPLSGSIVGLQPVTVLKHVDGDSKAVEAVDLILITEESSKVSLSHLTRARIHFFLKSFFERQ